MKKYLLLYVSLFLCLYSPSRAMNYDQEEEEYDQGNYENVDQQMPQNMMMQQPNMMYQNNMMTNQEMPQIPAQSPMQNTMMMQQPNMMYQNNMMMNPMGGIQNNANQEDETSKKEYVQSLVNNILRVNDNRRNNISRNTTQNGGVVIDRKLKNKLFKLQKDLDEISRSLSGISEDDETSSENKKSSKKSKSSAKATNSSKEKSKKSATSKKASSSKKSKSSKSKFRKKNRSKNRKFSKFNRPRNFYTVKQLTPKNAIKYVPKFYSYGYDRSENRQQVAPSSYKKTSYNIKNWGTGEIIPEETYYSRNSYFSDKSKCKNGCGAK